jgi:hypothetical protein
VSQSGLRRFVFKPRAFRDGVLEKHQRCKELFWCIGRFSLASAGADHGTDRRVGGHCPSSIASTAFNLPFAERWQLSEFGEPVKLLKLCPPWQSVSNANGGVLKALQFFNQIFGQTDPGWDALIEDWSNERLVEVDGYARAYSKLASAHDLQTVQTPGCFGSDFVDVLSPLELGGEVDAKVSGFGG